MTRVVVVEDHPLYREAIAALAGAIDGFQVAATYGDAGSALAAAPDDRPDVVILDLALPGIDGITALPMFQRLDPVPAVLVVTMSEDPPVLAAALRAGARGYVVKGSEPEDIARALQGVARGQLVFGEHVAAALLAQASRRSLAVPRASLPGLTEREVEVLDLVARGRSNSDIASALFISSKTARNHVSSILSKLGVGSRAEAVALARDAGLGVDGVDPADR